MNDIGVLINDIELISMNEGLPFLKTQGVSKVGLPWEFLICNNGDENPEIKKIYKNLSDNDMDIYTITTPRWYGDRAFSMTNQNNEQKMKYLDWLKRLIKVAGWINVKVIALYTSGACLPCTGKRRTESAIEFLNSLVPICKDAKIKIALVNSWYYEDGREDKISLDSIERLYELVAGLDSQYIGVCFDTGVSNMNQRVLEDIHILKEYIVQFYLNDTLNGDKESLQPGYGTVPWVAMGEILKSVDCKIPLFTNVPAFDDKNFSTIIEETRALLEGNVYTRPDGGKIGKDLTSGHIIIR